MTSNDTPVPGRESEGLFLRNVTDGSFDRLYTLIYDDPSDQYLIHDKSGQELLATRIDGFVRYAIAMDLDADGIEEIVMQISAQGNRGNGSEYFMLGTLEGSELTIRRTPISFNSSNGQANRAGRLTWYTDPRVSAVLEGEEVDLSNQQSQVADDGTVRVVRGVAIGEIRKFRETYGLRSRTLVLLSKESEPISSDQVQHLSFR